MIEGLKPYAEYKESGLPWLGRLPATWKLRRAKYLYREVDERSKTGSEEMLSVSHKTGVTPRSQKNVTMFMAESNVGHKVCRPDDLVINTLWAWMAALGVSRHHGMVSPAYGVYRPRDPEEFLPRFADQLLRLPVYAAEYQRCSTGVNSSRLRLYPEAFFRIPILMPSREEQEAIVRFLAHANHKIDGFIRAKRKLIGLLNEQKQAIIHQAVTRGLDPTVPLKPSGIPWLGDIPKHWETPMNRQIFREDIRPHNGKPERPLSLSQRDGLIATDEMSERSLKTLNYDNWKTTIPGDLVLNRFKAHLGVFFASTLRGIVSFHYGVFEPQRKLNTKFFELLYHTVPYRAIYAGRSNGMTVGLQNLSNQNFYAVRSVVPPFEEQEAIVAHSEDATVDLNTAITRTEREIALMQEYRMRLTADLVTGKLDVREAASRLPEVAELTGENPDAEAGEEPEDEETDTDNP